MTIHRSGIRAIVAAGVLAVAALASFPALAEFPPPVLLSSDPADGGWKFSGGPTITATFNSYLDKVSTTFTLERSGVALAGTTGVLNVAAVDPGMHRGILSFRPAAALPEAQYTAKVHAVAAADSETALGAADATFGFKVDLKAPKQASISTPVQNHMFGSGEAVTIGGTAADTLGVKRVQGIDQPDPTYTSGVWRIELRFYNPARSRPAVYVPGSIPSDPNAWQAWALAQAGAEATTLTNSVAGAVMTHELAYDCAPMAACSPWSATITDLPSGFWTVKAQAIDKAGNRGLESDPVGFLKL